MIIIKHLNKKYGNRKILNDINIELPRYGLVSILGESGCGKTTFLSCLAGLTNYQGDILIDGLSISNYSDAQKDAYRIKNIGIIFQDFKLYETETIERNILLPLEAVSGLKTDKKARKCSDLLKIVDLKVNPKSNVFCLSGGEKQRVAIARSLANDPCLILADEPTGNLDEKNSENIMAILTKIATTSLVVLVTHDEELAKKYSDQIINLEDGRITKIESYRKNVHKEYLPILKNKHSIRKIKLPLLFLSSHSFHTIFTKKWRTLLCNFITSLGLIGIGLSSILTNSISSTMTKAYSSFIDDDKIIITKNDSGEFNLSRFASSYYEIMDLKTKYPNLILDVGALYFANFEENFKDENLLTLASTTYRTIIDDFSARYINEYTWLDNMNAKIYPQNQEHLNNDEIVLGLTIKMIEDICFNLKIKRTVESLSDYLLNNVVTVRFSFANDSWAYSDEHLFTLKGFILDMSPNIYHTNHLWNEYVFEELMRMPTNDALDKKDNFPWVLKKAYYIVSSDVDNLLITSKKEKMFEPFIFEFAGKEYLPLLSKYKHSDRLICLSNTNATIQPSYSKYFLDANDNLSSPTFGSNSGIAIFPESLMMGFANDTYFSASLTDIEECINVNSIVNLDIAESINLPAGVLSGHYSTSITEGVRFRSDIQNYVFGSKPCYLNEIGISKTLAMSLFSTSDVLYKTLYIANNYSSVISATGRMYKNFEIVPLQITAVFDSPRKEITQDPAWSLVFFQKYFDISAFSLIANAISFCVKNKSKINETVLDLKQQFPQFEIVNPMSDINSNISELCSRFEGILLIFSIISSIIAVLVISLSTFLFALDNKKDILLARQIGISKNESNKFIYSNTLSICFISFLFSVIELLILTFLIEFIVSKTLYVDFTYTLTFKPFILMFVLIFGIGLLSSLFIAFVVGKEQQKTKDI
ncbi:MAG: ABC transporter ATP-binding protein [Bacilli bacterium]|nr:ABC transporter ATP-binding protein [Bacilli bacterium]